MHMLGLCGHFSVLRITTQNSGSSVRALGLRDHDQCIMMHLFIYFFIFRFLFFFFRWGGRGVGGAHAEPVVVWFWHTCVIHVQTLWSSQSIFMLLKRLAVCMEV